MQQHFWRRWSGDVLNQYQVRNKWRGESNSPCLNDLVLIRDENLPPLQWKLARIVALHPGEDGKIRVVTLKSQNNTFKRPIVKICPLPIESNSNHGDNDVTIDDDKSEAISDQVARPNINAICSKLRLNACKPKKI